MRSHRTDLFSVHVGLQQTGFFRQQCADFLDGVQPLVLLVPLLLLARIAVLSLFG